MVNGESTQGERVIGRRMGESKIETGLTSTHRELMAEKRVERNDQLRVTKMLVGKQG